jgi:hypothetical protein
MFALKREEEFCAICIGNVSIIVAEECCKVGGRERDVEWWKCAGFVFLVAVYLLVCGATSVHRYHTSACG